MTAPQEARMTTLQEAARKALACLELYDYEDLASCEACHELRTALAQQVERPVAYMAKNKNGGTESLIRARLLEQIGRSDDHDYTPLYAGVAQAPVEQRCTYCDGTGDVHSIDGEWRGTCHCAAVPAPQPAQGVPETNFGNMPVKFFANGTRFKMSFFQNEDEEGNYTDGTHVMCFDGYEKVLDGRWVALVAAEDDCHLQSAQPKQEPLTGEAIQRIYIETHQNGFSGRNLETAFARAIEAAILEKNK